MHEPPSEPTAATIALLADLNRLTPSSCAVCRAEVCGHEVLMSIALGCKDAPRCLGCLAGGLGRELDELREQLTWHFAGRECFSTAWRVACEREAMPETNNPVCLQRRTLPVEMPIETPSHATSDTTPLAVWDAGDLACGDLVLALRGRLNAMPSGSVLELTARDPAAPEDLPAWCRLTGHVLIQADHPRYLIQRKRT